MDVLCLTSNITPQATSLFTVTNANKDQSSHTIARKKRTNTATPFASPGLVVLQMEGQEDEDVRVVQVQDAIRLAKANQGPNRTHRLSPEHTSPPVVGNTVLNIVPDRERTTRARPAGTKTHEPRSNTVAWRQWRPRCACPRRGIPAGKRKNKTKKRRNKSDKCSVHLEDKAKLNFMCDTLKTFPVKHIAEPTPAPTTTERTDTIVNPASEMRGCGRES